MQNQNKTEVFTIGDLRLKHPPKIDAVPSVLKQDPNLPRNCLEFKQLAFLLINNSKITHMYNNTDKLNNFSSRKCKHLYQLNKVEKERELQKS